MWKDGASSLEQFLCFFLKILLIRTNKRKGGDRMDLNQLNQLCVHGFHDRFPSSPKSYCWTGRASTASLQFRIPREADEVLTGVFSFLQQRLFLSRPIYLIPVVSLFQVGFGQENRKHSKNPSREIFHIENYTRWTWGMIAEASNGF